MKSRLHADDRRPETGPSLRRLTIPKVDPPPECPVKNLRRAGVDHSDRQEEERDTCGWIVPESVGRSTMKSQYV